MEQSNDGLFWMRWVLANGLGEAVGLSAVLLAGFGVLGPRLAALTGVWPALLALLAGVLLGIFEGVVVGSAQWAVLRMRLPDLTLRTWLLATVIGAMVAWGLGMLPSTLMSAGTGNEQAAAEMPELLTYAMAAGMGIVAGAVLALAQWIALRAQDFRVNRAALWLPANALAWFFGMPVIFLGMGSIPAGASLLQAIPIVLAATLAAGLIVGAIHGFVLAKFMLPAHPSIWPSTPVRYP